MPRVSYEIVVDESGAITGLKKVSDAIQIDSQKGKDAFTEIGKAAEAATVKIRTAGTTVDQTAQKVDVLGQRAKSALAPAIASAQDSAKHYSTLAEKVGQASAQFAGLQSEIKIVAENMRRGEAFGSDPLIILGAAAQTTGRFFQQLGDRAQQAGRDLSIGITAPIVALTTAAILAANTIDKPLDLIRGRTGATGAALEALQKQFKDVFANAPQSADEIGQVFVALNTRLDLTGKELEDLVKAELDVARATGSAVVPTVEATTKVFQNWNIATQDQIKTLDLLLNASQKSGVPIEKLAELLARFGPNLRTLGFGLRESTALIAQFEKAGLNTEIMLQGFGRAIVQFARQGQAPKEVFDDLIGAISKLNDVQAIDLASKIFGGRGAAAQFVEAVRDGRFDLDKMSEAIAKNGDTVKKAGEETLSFAEVWSTSLHKIGVALDPLGKSLQKIFENDLLPMFKTVIAWVQKVSEGFQNLSPPVKDTILILVALAAAAGPVLIAFGFILSSVGKLIEAIPALALVAGKTGLAGSLVLLGEAALVVGAAFAGWKIGEWIGNLELFRSMSGKTVITVNDLIKKLFDLTVFQAKNVNSWAEQSAAIQLLNKQLDQPLVIKAGESLDAFEGRVEAAFSAQHQLAVASQQAAQAVVQSSDVMAEGINKTTQALNNRQKALVATLVTLPELEKKFKEAMQFQGLQNTGQGLAQRFMGAVETPEQIKGQLVSILPSLQGHPEEMARALEMINTIQKHQDEIRRFNQETEQQIAALHTKTLTGLAKDYAEIEANVNRIRSRIGPAGLGGAGGAAGLGITPAQDAALKQAEIAEKTFAINKVFNERLKKEMLETGKELTKGLEEQARAEEEIRKASEADTIALAANETDRLRAQDQKRVEDFRAAHILMDDVEEASNRLAVILAQKTTDQLKKEQDLRVQRMRDDIELLRTQVQFGGPGLTIRQQDVGQLAELQVRQKQELAQATRDQLTVEEQAVIKQRQALEVLQLQQQQYVQFFDVVRAKSREFLDALRGGWQSLRDWIKTQFIDYLFNQFSKLIAMKLTGQGPTAQQGQGGILGGLLGLGPPVSGQTGVQGTPPFVPGRTIGGQVPVGVAQRANETARAQAKLDADFTRVDNTIVQTSQNIIERIGQVIVSSTDRIVDAIDRLGQRLQQGGGSGIVRTLGGLAAGIGLGRIGTSAPGSAAAGTAPGVADVTLDYGAKGGSQFLPGSLQGGASVAGTGGGLAPAFGAGLAPLPTTISGGGLVPMTTGPGGVGTAATGGAGSAAAGGGQLTGLQSVFGAGGGLAGTRGGLIGHGGAQGVLGGIALGATVGMGLSGLYHLSGRSTAISAAAGGIAGAIGGPLIGAIVGAAVATGFKIWSLWHKSREQKFQKEIARDFNIQVQDDALLKQIKRIGEGQFGKQADNKRFETLRLDTVQGMLINYAQKTNQDPGMLPLYQKFFGVGAADNSRVDISKFANGGLVPGMDTGRDVVPAMLRPQEFVLRPEAVSAIGAGRLQGWNDNPKGFDKGGLVPVPGIEMPTMPVIERNDLLPHGFAQGGLISGTDTGRDVVPAMLRPHEFVLRPEAVAAIGAGRLQGWNDNPQGFAQGGLVTRRSSPGSEFGGPSGSLQVHMSPIITINGSKIDNPQDMAKVVKRQVELAQKEGTRELIRHLTKGMARDLGRTKFRDSLFSS